MRIFFHSGFLGGSDGKVSACNAGDLVWSQGQEEEKEMEKENDYQLQYSCLENPMDGGAW